MTNEIIIAGFGGQGVLSMGKILAYGALSEGREVTWMPSYGPEQRGGTANCTVIISDEEISSPIIDSYDCVVALNQPSLTKFESKVKPGGILLYDPHSIAQQPQRTDINIYTVEAMAEAARMMNAKTFNMIVLGALIKATSCINPDIVAYALQKTLPERHHKLIPANIEALNRGMQKLSKVK